jgi:hypothetical protein
MAIQDNQQSCAALIEKVASGQALSADEKMHLVECEHCMVELVQQLNHTATTVSLSPGINGQSVTGDGARSRPEALQALEHGQRVFAREFALDLHK